MMNRLKENREEWQSRKQSGAAMYRDDLRKIFDDPQEIESYFRGRQKDIDEAFDYLNFKENCNRRENE